MGLRGIDVAAAAIAAALTTVVGLVPDEPVAMRSSAPALRIASFNIETYPRPRTDALHRSSLPRFPANTPRRDVAHRTTGRLKFFPEI